MSIMNLQTSGYYAAGINSWQREQTASFNRGQEATLTDTKNDAIGSSRESDTLINLL